MAAQTEQPDWWEPEQLCTPLDAMVARRYRGEAGVDPAVALCPHLPAWSPDSDPAARPDLDQNDKEHRTLTHHLYGGGREPTGSSKKSSSDSAAFGILRALGFQLHTYHLNEGHAALLALDLLNRWRILP